MSASQTSTSSSGYVYTGYDCSTGKTKEITVAAPLAGGNLDSNGFFKYTTNDKGVTTITSGDYLVADDVNVSITKVYNGKVGSKIKLSAGDLDVTDETIFVDLRTAAQVKATTETKITSLDDMAAAFNATTPKAVEFDALIVNTGSTKKVLIFFVTGPTA